MQLLDPHLALLPHLLHLQLAGLQLVLPLHLLLTGVIEALLHLGRGLHSRHAGRGRRNLGLDHRRRAATIAGPILRRLHLLEPLRRLHLSLGPGGSEIGPGVLQPALLILELELAVDLFGLRFQPLLLLVLDVGGPGELVGDLLLCGADLCHQCLLLPGVLRRLALDVELLLLQPQALRLQAVDGAQLGLGLEGQAQGLPGAVQLGVVAGLLCRQHVQLPGGRDVLRAAGRHVAADLQHRLGGVAHLDLLSLGLSHLNLQLLLLDLDLGLLDRHLPLLQIPLGLEDPPPLGDRLPLLGEFEVGKTGLSSSSRLGRGGHLHPQLIAAAHQGPASVAHGGHCFGDFLLFVHQGHALLQRLDLVLVGLLLDVRPDLGDVQGALGTGAQPVVHLLHLVDDVRRQLEAAQLHLFREAALRLVAVPDVVLGCLDLLLGLAAQLHVCPHGRQVGVKHHRRPFLVERIDGAAHLVQAGEHLIEEARHRGGLRVSSHVKKRLDRVDHGSNGFRHQPHHASDQFTCPRHCGEDWHQATANHGRDRPDHIHDHLPDRGGRRTDRHQDRHHRAEEPEHRPHRFRDRLEEPGEALLQVLEGDQNRLHHRRRVPLQRLPGLGRDRLVHVVEVALHVGQRESQDLLAFVELLQLPHQEVVVGALRLLLPNVIPADAQLGGHHRVPVDVAHHQGIHLLPQLVTRDAEGVHPGGDPGGQLGGVLSAAFGAQAADVAEDDVEALVDLPSCRAGDVRHLLLDPLVFLEDGAAHHLHLAGGALHQLPVRAEDRERLRREDPRRRHLFVEPAGLCR